MCPSREPGETLALRPQFDLADEVTIPRRTIPDGSIDARTAYQLIHDELMFDGNPRLNLATFVTTWMEPEARRLIDETADRNLIDKDEYPQTAEIEQRCVAMLADLWHASGEPTGTSTTGSSEACMLGGIALLHQWRARGGTGRPNLVMGANVQVCWEKFCRYWDVEARTVPVGDGATHLTPERAVAGCDERTIGVVAILGSTFDGSYEPVADIAAALDALESDRGIDVPVHVDAASGGFIAPFLEPDLVWDFRLERVRSINASGHKFGLVYPGVGWALWRAPDALPGELVFNVDYLGGQMADYGLNFSRPGAQVVAQYFNLVRLGRDGYRRVQQDCRDVASWLAEEVAAIGPYALLSHGRQLPVLAFRLRDEDAGFTVYDVSERIRTHGWIVPAYRMPDGMEDVHVLRVVVRNGFSRDLAGLFAHHLREITAGLQEHGGAIRVSSGDRTGFHH
jgi:glutamate decarboxylase